MNIKKLVDKKKDIYYTNIRYDKEDTNVIK